MNNSRQLLLSIFIFIMLAIVIGCIRYFTLPSDIVFVSKIIDDNIRHIHQQDRLTLVLENLYYMFGIILFISIFVSYLIFKNDHEYRRRKCFIELMKDWNNNNRDGITFIIRNIIKKLSSEQRKKIMKYEQFEINDDLYEFIKICLVNANINNEMPKKNNVYLVNKEQSIVLRQMVVTYLNRVECLLAASIHNVSDFELTKEQFNYLTKPDENYEGMINDFGVKDCFPCTVKFIKKCNEQKDNSKKRTG